MEHHFNIEIAQQYGILEAVLLNHIKFWIAKNVANEANYHEGEYWTYNSVRAFHTLFPYASEKQIRNALNHLQDEGLIKTNNFNKSSYDRTLWYALTEKGKSICQIEKIHLPCGENGSDQKGEPIPYNKPYKNTYNTITKVIEKPPKTYGNSEINELFEEWEKQCGFPIKTKVQANRYACNRLIKSHGLGKVLAVLPIVAQSYTDQYAPNISNFMDLAEKWDKLGVWYKKTCSTNFMKNGKIVIPTSER